MKKGWFCLIILFAVTLMSISIGLAQEYMLSDLYQQALKNSEKIKYTEENLFIAQMTKNKAWAVLMPKVTAFGTYNRFTEDKYVVSTTRLPAPLPTISNNVLIQPEQSGTWGVRAEQSFSLSARELNALKIAGQSITKSEYDLDVAKSDFVLVVAVSFYDVLKAQKVLEIADANLERLKKYHHFVETRVKVGELTKTALLRAKGELSGAYADQLRAANGLQLARAALVRVTAVEPDFQLKDEKLPVSEMCELNSLRQTALDERPDLKGYDMQTRMAEQQVKYARGAFWPSVSLFAIYNRADQEPVSATFNDESILGGVSLSFPFFEGGLRIAEYKEALAKERQARLAYDDLKKSIDVELKAACLDLETLKGSLKFLEDQQIFAKDNYNAVMKQFENGLANSLDVMDANTLLLTADRDVAKALYNYQIANLLVKKTSGTLLRFVHVGK